jgi:hypothetical protein
MTGRRRASRSLPASRLWSRCRRDETTGCLIFVGGHSDGYGIISVNGVPQRTHRVAYRLSRRRRIPVGRMVTHRCPRTKGCCEPTHLRLGDHRSNAADAIAHGEILRGEAHPNSILTTERVLAIRAAYAAGLGTQAEVARAFEIGRSTVGEIVRLERWRHLPVAS